ncbi:hypothetical protein T492DRAFT_831622 [Pavlovales sp. CCMP2436]|nr:hypothetical protein T492DRAFT_831622 [Pavlovales sp. CCMP2436]
MVSALGAQPGAAVLLRLLWERARGRSCLLEYAHAVAVPPLYFIYILYDDEYITVHVTIDVNICRHFIVCRYARAVAIHVPDVLSPSGLRLGLGATGGQGGQEQGLRLDSSQGQGQRLTSQGRQGQGGQALSQLGQAFKLDSRGGTGRESRDPIAGRGGRAEITARKDGDGEAVPKDDKREAEQRLYVPSLAVPAQEVGQGVRDSKAGREGYADSSEGQGGCHQSFVAREEQGLDRARAAAPDEW